MKELTIKEKAERYDKISKEVKDFFDGKQKMYSDVEQTLNHLFPELAKSEDEKIKEDLIEWIDEFPDTIWRGHYKKDIIAWLEKRGEHAIACSKEQMKVLDEVLNFAANHESLYWNDYIFETLSNLIRQLKNIKL